MKTLLPLLAVFLLAAACRQTEPPPPPPPVQDPPAQGPLLLGQEGFSLKFQQTLPEFGAQVYVAPRDGAWRDYMTQLNLNDDLVPSYFAISMLRLREGRLEVWAQDLSPTKVYGGRRFRWVYPFRLDDSGFPPRLVFPDGPVSFEALPEFPWGDAAPTDDRVRGYLRTVSVGGAFQACVRQDWQPNPSRPLIDKGLWGEVFMMGGEMQPAQPGQPNYLVTYLWQDGVYEGSPKGDGAGTFSLGPASSDQTYLDGRAHSAVMISKSYGVGRVRQAWEGRWFRAYNRGYGAYDDPAAPGGVRCEFGEGWRVEEVSDPEEVGLLEAYEESFRSGPIHPDVDYYARPSLNPKLCPTAWRRPGGTCEAG